MTPTHSFHWIAVALVLLCTACSNERDSATKKLAGASLPVTRIAENEPTLALSDIDLSLELVSLDKRDLPKEIRITFRNTSSKRGCLAIPRPVVEGEDYDASLPCLCMGMRAIGGDGEPIFLFTKPAGQSAGPLEGVYLDAGAEIARQYDISSFCVIGHGIGPKQNANFSACYHIGDKESELRAYLISEWGHLTRINSNPVRLRSSELDFSVREKLGD